MSPKKRGQRAPIALNLFDLPDTPTTPELRVKKRNGRIESFSIQKLARSIRQALNTAGQQEDEVEFSLASAIQTYLRDTYGTESIIPSDEIHQLVIQVLTDFGDKESAKTYRDYGRFKRLQQHLISKEKELLKAQKPSADGESSVSLLFDPNELLRIRVGNILERFDIKPEKKEDICNRVLDFLHQLQMTDPSEFFILELCQAIVAQQGINIRSASTHSYIHISTQTFFETYQKSNVAFSPKLINLKLGKIVKEEMVKSCLYPPNVVKAIEKGFLLTYPIDAIDEFDTLEVVSSTLWQQYEAFQRSSSTNIRTPDIFWSALIDITEFWSDFYTQTIHWHAFNWAIAPLLKVLEGNDYRRWIIQWLEELKRYSHYYPCKLSLSFTDTLPPSYLISSAIGGGGVDLGTPYESYRTQAQEFILDTFDVLAHKKHVSDFSYNPIKLQFLYPLHLNHTSTLWQDIVQFIENQSGYLDVEFVPSEHIQKDVLIETTRVTINLARIALLSKSREAFISTLYEVCDLAFQAIESKLQFLLHSHDPGNQPTIVDRSFQFLHMNEDSSALLTYPVCIALAGLQEAIYVLWELKKKVRAIDIFSLAEPLLKKIQSVIHSIAESKHMRYRLAIETNFDKLQMLAIQDYEDYPKISLTLDITMPPNWFVPTYSSHLCSISFEEARELVPLLDYITNIARMFSYPCPIHLQPTRDWDGILMSEVIYLLEKHLTDPVPIGFRLAKKQ